MINHQYGPKGHIVDAFLEHLKQMTEADWLATFRAARATGYDASKAAMEAARDAAEDAAEDATELASWDAAFKTAGYAVRDAAGYAAFEIQSADLLRERGQPFFFLPLFGFADERDIIKQGST